jgi:translation initiation factor eIF-2B subunit delta
MNTVLEERVRELREERHHGASWMARHALEALVEAVRNGEDPVEVARVLASTRISLGAIAGAVGRVLTAGTPEQVVAEAEAVIGSRDRAAKAIAIMLASEISGTVMTHSASGTVREALVHTPPQRVVCTVSEPGGEGRRLAAKLRAEGIEVELIADDEGPDAARESDLVLLGADTVFNDGSLVNKIGTGAIASAAKDAGVTVIVACEIFKLAPFEPQPPAEDTFELIPAAMIDRIGRGDDDDDVLEAILLDREPLESVGRLRQDDIHVLAPADIEHGTSEVGVASSRDGLEDVAEVAPDRQLVHVHSDEAHLALAVLAQGAQERDGSGATDGGDENGERLEHLRSGAFGARNA